MSNMETALTTLLGREPKADEIAKLYTIRDTFGLGNNDPIWAILVAYSHYEILYAQIPEKIVTASQEMLAEHRLGLEMQAKATQKIIEKTLIEKVSETAQELAERALNINQNVLVSKVKKEYAVAMCIGTVIAFTALTIAAYFGYLLGTKSQDRTSLPYAEAKAAQKFSAYNDIAAMLSCNDKKFQKTDKDRTCQGEWRIK